MRDTATTPSASMPWLTALPARVFSAFAAFLVLLLAFVATFGWMAWAGNRAFMRVLIDTDLAMWHTLMKHLVRGEALIFWNPFSGTWTHYFARDHFDPLLFLVAPLWAMLPSNVMFAWIQIAAYAGTAVLLFVVARSRLESEGWSALIASGFLLSPWPTYSLYNHFNSSPFLTLFLPWAVWGVIRGRTGWYWVAVGGLLLSREDAALMAMVLGLYAALVRRRYRLGGLTVLIAGAYVLLVVLVVMPYLAGGAPYPYVRRGYSWLGGTATEALWRLAAHPLGPLRTLYERGALQSLLRHLLPFGFLPLMSWRGAIFLLPVTYLILLSDLAYHHAYWVATLAGLGAVEGVWQLRASVVPRLGRGAEPALALLFGMCAVGAHVAEAYSPLGRQFEWAEFARGPEHRVMRKAMGLVPPGSRVAGSRLFLTHLIPTRDFECIWDHVEMRAGAGDAGLWCQDTGAPLDSEYVLLSAEALDSPEVRRLTESGAYTLVFERNDTVLYHRAGG